MSDGRAPHPHTRLVVPTVTGATLRPRAHVRMDGHGHAWIAPPSLAADAGPALRDEEHQAEGLRRFARAAGPRRAALLDCQPPGCGRDATALARLAEKSGVAIAAVTGFHLRRYYPMGLRPWQTAYAATEAFLRELDGGLREQPVARAAAVKAAYTGEVEDGDACWEAAIEACRRTGALLLVHTEGGRGVEALVAWLHARGLPPERVYLCHLDARADLALHLELAAAGVLLGYDTLLRPRRQAGADAGALLCGLLESGHARSMALGLNLGSAERWSAPPPTADGVPPSRAHAGGPATLVTHLEPRLAALGADGDEIDWLLGGSLLERAARPEGGLA